MTRLEPPPSAFGLSAGQEVSVPTNEGPATPPIVSNEIHAAPRNERNSDPVGGDGSPRRSARGDLSQLLSLLADRPRMRILHILAAGERPVVALTSELRLPQPTVSHHLAWLKTLDLVTPRRQGKHIYYALGAAVAYDAGAMSFTAGDATVTVTPRKGPH